MFENNVPERIWIDDMMAESSRQRGYGRYYVNNGNGAPDIGEYVRISPAREAAIKELAAAAKATTLSCNIGKCLKCDRVRAALAAVKGA